MPKKMSKLETSDRPVISASALALIRALAIKYGYWDAERECPTEKGRKALEEERHERAT